VSAVWEVPAHRRVRIFLFLLLVGCTSGTWVHAQTQESVLSDSLVVAWADEGLDHLYNFRFPEASVAFGRIEERYPQHPIAPFLDGLSIWWQIMPTMTVEDHSHDRAFIRAMTRTADLADALLKKDRSSFDGRFFRGAAHGFRGRLYSDREEWLRAAQDGRRALNDIFDLSAADTTNADLVFGEGVYRYFADAIPERYPIVRPLMLFFPSGDKEWGLEQLDRVVREGRFVRAEAAYFLLQIYTVFEPDVEKASAYASLLTTWYPENPVFLALEGRVAFRWGQWDRARALYTELLEMDAPNAVLSQAHYYMGRLDMIDVSNESALWHFQRVTELESVYDGMSYFRVQSMLREGMVHDVNGDRDAAVKAYERVRRLPDRGNSRDRAKQYLRSPYTRGAS